MEPPGRGGQCRIQPRLERAAQRNGQASQKVERFFRAVGVVDGIVGNIGKRCHAMRGGGKKKRIHGAIPQKSCLFPRKPHASFTPSWKGASKTYKGGRSRGFELLRTDAADKNAQKHAQERTK
jgi:hypothetical protein